MKNMSTFPESKAHHGPIIGFLFGMVLLSGPSLASDLSGVGSEKNTHQSEQPSSQNQLDPGHRYIHGTVEGINQNTIKVNAGEVGEMSPRYFDIEKVRGDEDVQVGDALRVEVNLQNKVVGYRKISGDGNNAQNPSDTMNAQSGSSGKDSGPSQ